MLIAMPWWGWVILFVLTVAFLKMLVEYFGFFIPDEPRQFESAFEKRFRKAGVLALEYCLESMMYDECLDTIVLVLKSSGEGKITYRTRLGVFDAIKSTLYPKHNRSLKDVLDEELVRWREKGFSLIEAKQAE